MQEQCMLLTGLSMCLGQVLAVQQCALFDVLDLLGKASLDSIHSCRERKLRGCNTAHCVPAAVWLLWYH